MNAAIYARVSTTGQKDNGYSLGSQVRECQTYAERNGLNVVAAIQDDISGATRLDEREGGRGLLELIESGQISAVIVWRLDRLSRPPDDELSRLLTTIEHFQRHKVTLYDCESGPIRNDMASILITFFKGLAASKERADITIRTTNGRRNKAQDGKWVGAGWAAYGYRKVGERRETRLEINEVEAATVRRIFNLYTGRNGFRAHTLNEIARILTDEGIPTPGRAMGPGKVWLASTITESIIDRRAYTGELSYDGIVINLPELTIVDKDTWQAAQAQRQANKQRARRGRPGERFLLSTRMTCTCGGAINGASTVGWKGRIYRYYRCSRGRHDGAKVGCNLGNLPADQIESDAWAWLKSVVESDARLNEVIEDMADRAEADIEPVKRELADVDRMIAEAEGKIARLVKGFGDTTDEVIAFALKREINDTGKMKAALEKRRAAIEGQITTTAIPEWMKAEIRALAQEVRARIGAGGTAEDKRNLFDALDVRCELFEDAAGQLKGRISCGLGTHTGIISIGSLSSTRTGISANGLRLFVGEFSILRGRATA